jgi:exopolysaccharide/PEP-CTERM locus tyrosine autokinase
VGKVFKALHKSLDSEQNSDNFERATVEPLKEGLEQDELAERKRVASMSVASASRPLVSTREHLREDLTGVDGWDEKLVVFSDPASPLAENFRLLRSQILYPASGKAYKKILVTSTVPGSGKSFVCANLGISLAQGLDQHALMVDCDLRRSRLASLFNCQNSRGLVDYLQNGEDLGRLIVKTGMRKLSVLPSGLRPVNPAELLGSAKIEMMFAELENRYNDRFILIDTPPTLAASETAVLAKHVDGIILVVRWGLGGRASIKQLVDSLGHDKIIGVVFNAYEANTLSAKMSGYDEYGQYAGGYGD